jgi:hypothetical protein
MATFRFWRSRAYVLLGALMLLLSTVGWSSPPRAWLVDPSEVPSDVTRATYFFSDVERQNLVGYEYLYCNGGYELVGTVTNYRQRFWQSC